jgi:hypothetical protein
MRRTWMPKAALMAVIVVSLALPGWAVSPCLAEDGGAKLKGEVTALLQHHDEAFSAQDLKGVMKTFVAGPEIFLMGTGPGEIYRGEEGVEGAYSQFFTKFDRVPLLFTTTGFPRVPGVIWRGLPPRARSGAS